MVIYIIVPRFRAVTLDVLLLEYVWIDIITPQAKKIYSESYRWGGRERERRERICIFKDGDRAELVIDTLATCGTVLVLLV
jgi:hypothetical protein